MNNLDKYIKEYKNNKYRYFLSNPLFRIKATHILGTFILVISALFFTENIIAIILQLLVAFVITLHDFDDRFLKNNLASKIDELNESQIYIETIIDTSAHAIIAIDDRGVVSRFNQTAQDMFGFSSQEITSVDDLVNIIPQEYKQRHITGISNFFETGKIHGLLGKTMEFRGLHKDGTEFPIKITLGYNQILDKKLIVANIENITFEKEQQKIAASHQRHAQMGEMIGNIAHQWRQPLSGITMLASSSKLTNSLGMLDSNELDASLDKVIDYSAYLSQTIEDFRNFYKEDKEIEKFDIIEKINFSINLVDAAYRDFEISIKKEFNSSSLKANGLPNEFSQVIVNILNNAKDILIEKDIDSKKLLVKVFQDEHYNICEIYDNAGGVPQNIIKKIFDPYFTTKHQSQGTGIGLHMSKDIIQSSLNGILNVQNREFKIEENKYFGACFIIKLPIIKEV
ncbi:MAG: PAS domain-containing sensor histidine kinase [Campylobacterota bacterium]|nr:PAS domain-containing sensor histidine kinase [Campylobacterota bacterium]